MKPIVTLFTALLLTPLAALHAADIGVVNGDFSDLSGLEPLGGHGWHQGIPAGWKSSARASLYAVHTGSDGKQPVCNVSQLGILEQNVGTLAQASDVVLTMDVADDWRKGAELNAEILDADGESFGSIQLKAGRVQRLIVGKVPAGSSIVIRFHAANGTTPALDNVSVTSHPPGSQIPTPQVRIRRFQPDQPLARARRVASISADLDHLGAEDVEAAVRLSLPPGIRVVESNATDRVRFSAADGCSRLTWRLEADEPMTADLVLELKAADGSPVAHQPLRMLFLPPVEKSTPLYIPEPKPVPTDRLIGAHHCPLWESDQPNMWLNVLKHPERTPALGFYSQEHPEVADWETKWAVEHGISFFIYCWYRTSQGGAVKTRFGSAIHDALFKSRFADRMKFTIMWENQSRGQAGVADERDLFTNLLPYWLENYFKHPSYLKVDNKPLLFIYRPEFLVEDLGGVTNVSKAFARMRQVCREAGFDGLHLLGEYRGTDPEHLKLMRSLGLDYTFAYCWYVHDSPAPERAISTQMEYIRQTQALNILPQVVTVSQAWSGWQDEGTIWKIPPPQFETLLQQAKEFTATLPKEQLGSRMLLLDNWNEWGEGHYLAPYREYGFGYLDAVRKVFSTAPEAHDDLLPEDIGRGPYDSVIRAHFDALEEKQRLLSTRALKTGAPGGLVAWWTFDDPEGSPVALDYSGHRHGGVLEKARRTAGFDGSALVCDGGSVFVPRSRALGELQKFTIECRVRTDVANQDNRWMVNGVFGHNLLGGFRIGVLGGKPCFQVPQTDWSHHLTGREPLPAGKWVHLAATFDGATMRLFMDGEECGSMSRPGALLPTDGRLILGSYEVNHHSHFQGLLDDVRIYRRVLPGETIRSNATVPPP
ncbi:MAG: hypothetical protein FJ276_05110 [Planctomycetes bacterium]|nr:hypothetical protein [Planctomycetota bacterium]